VIGLLIQVINLFSQILILVIFLYAIFSYFLDPYHPVRRGVSNFVEPMLSPIRRVIPPVGALDFSPLILIVLIQLATRLIVALLL